MSKRYLNAQLLIFFSPSPLQQSELHFILFRSSFSWTTYSHRWKSFYEKSAILETRQGGHFILSLPSASPKGYMLKDILVPINKCIIKQ